MNSVRSLRRVAGALLVLCALAALLAGPVLAAWPLTPRTTYIATSTPAIKAADLNAFQEAINRGFLGTYSHAGIVVDGTGGASVTPVAGSAIVSRAAMGAVTPTATVAPGEVARGSVPLCWAKVDAVGALVKGFNVFSTSHPNPGDYRVICQVASASQAVPVILATCNPVGGTPCLATTYEASNGAGKLGAQIQLWTLGGSTTDQVFSVVVYGE